MAEASNAELVAEIEALRQDLQTERRERQRLQAELDQRDTSLTEAFERETATSEVLRVISRSPTDVQPVFEAIVESAARLCNASNSTVYRYDGQLVHLEALYALTSVVETTLRGQWPRPLGGESVVDLALRDARVIHFPDVESDPRVPPLSQRLATMVGFRSVLTVPMLRENRPIGCITVTRPEPSAFSDTQISLLQTFADQAVIAIENVRLFTELEAKNRDLTTALSQQTATAEILRVIASSPAEEQPVFDAIAWRAVVLCNATVSAVFRLDGDIIHHVAGHGRRVEAVEEMRRRFPRRLQADDMPGRVISTRQVVHRPAIEPSSPLGQLGIRSLLSAPMLRGATAIGAISVERSEPVSFTGDEITLLETFADQAVIAIENVRLFTELQEKNRALTEALEQQTATSEILRVISSSPTDPQPVFDAIADAALRLCGAASSLVTTFDGELLYLCAQAAISQEGTDWVRGVYPRRPSKGFASGRAFLTRAIVQIPDVTADAEYKLPVVAQVGDFRSILAVPMLRDGLPIGTINVHKAEPGPFTDKQVALLQTFADQAVIAIENVRLFKELEARNRDLTATSEILRVIASSPTDLQPVFDTIAERSMRLCEASFGWVLMFDGELIHLRSLANVSPEGADALRQMFPVALSRGTFAGRTILTGAVVHVPDVLDDSEYEFKGTARATTARSLLCVPMLREGTPIGVIVVTRAEPGPFSDNEIALLKTFADQAVIAVENVRLFTELQASNRELTTALDTQTATSDILRVISQSQTNVQPVFDAIVDSAVRLLRGNVSTLTRLAGDQIELAAFTSSNDVGDAVHRTRFPLPLHSDEDHGQAMRNRAPFNSADAPSDPRLPETQRASARVRGYRSVVVVPLLRHDEAVGTLGVGRGETGGFTDDEIALLQTFAAQAVIAIENARLLSELQVRTQELTRSVGELRALGEVSQAVSSTLDLETVLVTIVGRAVQLSGCHMGIVYEFDEATETFHARATHRVTAEHLEALRAEPIRLGQGAVGRAGVIREPVQVADIQAEWQLVAHQARALLVREGMGSLLAVPLVREDRLLGGLVILRSERGAFTSEVVTTLQTFATQSVLAIQNARLFREIEEKSRELEAASRHKSEFLSNMSHELRTPLNAIIGFSEVLGDRMFGELTDKQEEYLKDIMESGHHLLSLINDILDLSKIEAGRMELELTEFDLPQAIDNALTLVRERAGRRGIALHQSVDERLGVIRGDERKVKQVLLNLLSNALKFTPEGGRIDVSAHLQDGSAEIFVADTGVGIAPEDQEAVFEEFRQVGGAEKKAEGTGLGLTLCRKFVELHGGRIWVKSQVSVGSTFTFTLPVRRGDANATGVATV
jgi:GAF domain-containing protein